MCLRVGVLVLAVVATAGAADNWTAREDTDRRVVETTGTAAVGDLRVAAFLSLSCNRTGAPVAWLDYTIAEADKVTKVFDLSPFEGPDAPAQSHALVSVELTGGQATRPLVTHASGWYSAEHTGGFGFGIGGADAESKALSRLIKRMAREGTALRIRVTSFDKSRRTIVSEFPLATSRDTLAHLASFCR